MWKIESITEEDAWFVDYLKEVTKPLPDLPPKEQRIGASTARWFETEPGIAFIETTGGTVDDRWLAESVTRDHLAARGIKQATYTFDRVTKLAAWDDIMAKAKRLIQSGNVTLLRNGVNNVVATVVGDHDTYQSEFSREDPNSRAITQWQCECPWDQYAFQRTRKWKKYEGRPCAHVLATYWKSLSAPVDQEYGEAAPPAPGVPPGQTQMFNVPQTAPPPGRPPGGGGGPVAPPQGQQLSIPGFNPGGASGTPPMAPTGVPAPPSLLPPFPGEPVPPTPVSVPGAKPPHPSNPVQYPGGTYSHEQIVDYGEAAYAPVIEIDGVPYFGKPDALHESTWPKDVLQKADRLGRVGYSGKIAWHNFEGDGWHFGAKGDTFNNSDMVRIDKEEYGVAEGKSVEHGAGQYKLITQNSIGEVLGQDPTTGWVDVIFPIHDSGPMEPYHIRAWIDPSNLTPMPNIKRPGPFIRRRR